MSKGAFGNGGSFHNSGRYPSGGGAGRYPGDSEGKRPFPGFLKWLSPRDTPTNVGGGSHKSVKPENRKGNKNWAGDPSGNKKGSTPPGASGKGNRGGRSNPKR
jgi:hypothetical protein